LCRPRRRDDTYYIIACGSRLARALCRADTKGVGFVYVFLRFAFRLSLLHAQTHARSLSLSHDDDHDDDDERLNILYTARHRTRAIKLLFRTVRCREITNKSEIKTAVSAEPGSFSRIVKHAKSVSRFKRIAFAYVAVAVAGVTA